MDQLIATIKAAMQAQDVSISELARRVPTSRAYIHRVINGEHSPTLAWCYRVAQALDLEVTIQPLQPKSVVD